MIKFSDSESAVFAKLIDYQRHHGYTNADMAGIVGVGVETYKKYHCGVGVVTLRLAICTAKLRGETLRQLCDAPLAELKPFKDRQRTLREVLKASDKSNEVQSGLLGVSLRHFSRFINGEAPLSRSTISKIAAGLNMTIDEVLDD